MFSVSVHLSFLLYCKFGWDDPTSNITWTVNEKYWNGFFHFVFWFFHIFFFFLHYFDLRPQLWIQLYVSSSRSIFSVIVYDKENISTSIYLANAEEIGSVHSIFVMWMALFFPLFHFYFSFCSVFLLVPKRNSTQFIFEEDYILDEVQCVMCACIDDVFLCRKNEEKNIWLMRIYGWNKRTL